MYTLHNKSKTDNRYGVLVTFRRRCVKVGIFEGKFTFDHSRFKNEVQTMLVVWFRGHFNLVNFDREDDES